MLGPYPRPRNRAYVPAIPAHTRAFPEVVPKCGWGAAPAARGLPDRSPGRLSQTACCALPFGVDRTRRVTRPSGNTTRLPDRRLGTDEGGVKPNHVRVSRGTRNAQNRRTWTPGDRHKKLGSVARRPVSSSSAHGKRVRWDGRRRRAPAFSAWAATTRVARNRPLSYSPRAYTCERLQLCFTDTSLDFTCGPIGMNAL